MRSLTCIQHVERATEFRGELARQIAKIIEDVCQRRGVRWEAVVGWKNSRTVNAARGEVCSALRRLHTAEDFTLTLEEIATVLSGRHHTTVLQNANAYDTRRSMGGG